MKQALERTCDRLEKVKKQMNELKAFRQVICDKLDKTDNRLLTYIAEYQELIQMKYSFEFKAIEDEWKTVEDTPCLVSAGEFLNICDSIFDRQ